MFGARTAHKFSKIAIRWTQASATSLPKQLFAASKMVGIPKAKIPEAISLPKSEKRQSREAKSSESTSDSKKKLTKFFVCFRELPPKMEADFRTDHFYVQTDHIAKIMSDNAD